MNHQTFLQTFKDDLKKQVATDLEKSLEQLFTVLNKQTALRTELLALEGRFNQVKSESLKSIISYETKTLTFNQIRNDAFDFVGKLDFQDLDPSFSPELKTNIEAFNASTQKEEMKVAEPVNTDTALSKVSEPSPSSTKEVNEQPLTANSAATPISFPEFELFVAQHQATLKAFPRVFRRAREISIRRDMNSANAFHQKIQTNLATLQKFETLLKPIRDNIKQIRLDRNNEIYWLQYKMIKEIPETAEEENLESLSSTLPKLESLHETLDKLNLI